MPFGDRLAAVPRFGLCAARVSLDARSRLRSEPLASRAPMSELGAVKRSVPVNMAHGYLTKVGVP